MNEFNVSPSNPCMYTVTVMRQGEQPVSDFVYVNPQRCYYDKGHFLNGYDDIVNYVFSPENPYENPNMQVQWKIEELDGQTLNPAYSVENTTCWNDVNMPNANCTFKGFDGFNVAESIAELEAGNCSGNDGIFDPDKVYLITRSFRLPGDPWESYSLFIGPGTEDTPEDRSISASSETATALFRMAQDRTTQTVSFSTTVDNGRFEILDASGRHIAALDLSDETYAYSFDVAAFAKGLYVVRLVSGSQTTTEKFVVE
jgi:hypothetical protein